MKKQKQKNKILYDKDSQVLSIEIKKDKSVDSDIFGNLVVDYNKKGDAVRASIYNIDFGAFKENLKAMKIYSRQFNTSLTAI